MLYWKANNRLISTTLPLLKKCDLRKPINYQVKSFEQKINWLKHKIYNILRRNAIQSRQVNDPADIGTKATHRWCKDLSAVLAYIDFKKVFDIVHRRKIVKILWANGIPYSDRHVREEV